MPYTQIALHWLSSIVIFALVAFVARRSRSDMQGILAGVFIGLAVGYLLNTVIHFAVMFYPVGMFDPWIAAKLRQFGFVK
ncbi:MAG TPA: hypothetical protein PK970_05825 [Hyphomicrobiaceae bacterium]|nr:hypothetical protein [Hyphomicrobiaceae bacterium]